MRDNNIHEIIGKYLANEITDNEVLIFNEWVNRCDENFEEFKLHKKTWEETRIRYNTLGSDFVFRDVLNKITIILRPNSLLLQKRHIES